MPANSQNPLQWDDVRVFLALWRHRTLTAAGARLGVNASTVGRRLEALERALEARLFDRTPDGVLPTAAAEELHPHAERLELAAAGLTAAAEQQERGPEGLVRLTAPPGVAEAFVAPALPRLFARHPGLRVELDASIQYADLTRREADLALRLSRPTTGDLVAVRLAEQEDVVLGAARWAREPLRALGDARWISWGSDLAHIPSARWVAGNVPAEAVLLRTSSISAQVAAAQAGLGVLLLPGAFAGLRGLLEVKLAPRLLRTLPPRPRQSLWLVGHRALRDVPRIAAVWDFLVGELGAAAR